MRYSYSGISTYEGCPLSYKFAKVERRPEITSPEARRGTEVHDCITAYVKHLAGTQLAVQKKTDLDFVRSLGISVEAREILETFANTHLFDSGDYLAECRHTIQLDGFDWTGVIDLIHSLGSQIKITDYKTFWRALSQAEVDDNLQLKGYVPLVADLFPDTEEFICEMDFVRLGVNRQVNYTKEDLPGIVDDITRRVRQVEADKVFEARPGPRCDWCLGKSDCPALESGVEVITSTADAETLADELIVLRARDKEIQALLKPYCTREGPLQRNGMVVGYQTVHSAGYKVEALMELLERHGYEPLNYLRPDAAAIKKIPKKDKELADDLALIEQDKSSSRFEVRKGEA